MKKDFPLLVKSDLVYLDSAATTQKPEQVIVTITDFYQKENANIHRGLYPLSESATQKYLNSRKKIASFIGADANEIVFTKNTTEALNIIAYGLSEITVRKEIVLTELEHHANIVPWLQLQGYTIKYIPLNGYDLDYDAAEKIIGKNTAVVSVTHVSNVFGTIIDIDRISKIARKQGALFVVDGAQSLAHISINVKTLDIDFLACSAHKAFGPMGVGFLFGKKQLLEKLPPLLYGGEMISSVTYEKATWAKVPEKFEAGTQDVAGAIGFGEAISYIEEKGLDKIKEHDQEILTYALTKIRMLKNIKVYHTGKGLPILSFNITGVHPHDVASLLADKNICVRAGHHCAMPLMNKLNLEGTVRASFSIYNSKKDVDALVEAIKGVQKVFHG